MATTRNRDDERREALRAVLREALEVHIEADQMETPPEVEARIREYVLRLAAAMDARKEASPFGVWSRGGWLSGFVRRWRDFRRRGGR